MQTAIRDCSLLDHAECAAMVVVDWDWTTSTGCPEACTSQFYSQKDIQVWRTWTRTRWFLDILSSVFLVQFSSKIKKKQ